jgi:GNAT superfamily N-acetyltransferase
MADETFLLDSFTVAVCDMAAADVKALHALSLSVGWAHRAEDWQFMREIGRGVVALDESGRVHGSAMWFPFGEAFAAIGMVIVTPLLQNHGGGQRLMQHVLEQVKGRALGLHATEQSHHLFRSIGFADEGTVHLHQGPAGPPPELLSDPAAQVRELGESDLADILRLDRMAAGLDRRPLVDALMARSHGMALSRGGRLEAFALMRPFGRGAVIGPVIAASEDDAMRVIHPLIAAQKDRFVRIDLGAADSRLAQFIEQCGLPVCERVTRMSLGGPWPFISGAEASMYALASHATG